MTLREGSSFGPYVLHRRLARGGMGEIWLAERRGISGFSKRLVIKTILEAYSDQPDLVEMFLREGRIAAGLSHPNIAQTFDLGCHQGTYFMAMELVEGRDLRDILIYNIERGQLVPLDLVLRIMAEVCQGLYHAHCWRTPDGEPAGIIHRDISPQNILVTFAGGVKIVDFGVAKAVHLASRTKSGVLKGKYAYMSPEQIRGRAIDGRSDLFSAGVVMYELVTGRRLFKRESELSTLEAVIRADVPPPDQVGRGVPRQLERIIMRALEPDPQRRYRDGRQMQMAIEQCMLETGLLASSAHLSAYMNEVFGEGGGAGDWSGNSARRMEEIPSVKQRAPDLERTSAYSATVSGQQTTPARPSSRRSPVPRKPAPREPTRNLLAGAAPSVRSGGSRRRTSWLSLALLAVVAAAASGLLVYLVLSRGRQPADAGPAVAKADRPVAGDGGMVAASRQRQPAVLDAGPAAIGLDGESARPAADSGPGTEDASAPDGGVGMAAGDPAGNEDGAGSGRSGRSAAVRRFGWLEVSTTPPAIILVDGRRVGSGSRRLRLRPGRHLVEARLEGGGSKSLPVTVVAGRSKLQRITLGRGRLKVLVQPWATVWLDGRKVGETPLAPLSLYEGTYQLLLRNRQLGREERVRVRVRADADTSIVRDWR